MDVAFIIEGVCETVLNFRFFCKSGAVFRFEEICVLSAHVVV